MGIGKRAETSILQAARFSDYQVPPPILIMAADRAQFLAF
jgi:hypothetical protein